MCHPIALVRQSVLVRSYAVFLSVCPSIHTSAHLSAIRPSGHIFLSQFSTNNFTEFRCSLIFLRSLRPSVINSRRLLAEHAFSYREVTGNPRQKRI